MNRAIHTFTALTFLLLFSYSVCAASGPTATDDKIGKYAVIFGTNRLAKNPNDKTGHLLIKLAMQIKPENDALLLTMAFVEKKKKIARIKTKYSELEFAKLLSKRASELIGQLPKNGKIGPLALVYLQSAELLYSSKLIILRITKLLSLGIPTELGFTNDLEKNFETGVNFPELFKDAEPMGVMKPVLVLTKNEKTIVKAAMALGTKRLNADGADTKGLIWLRLAGFLKPDDKQYLLAVGLMLRGKKLDKLKATMTEGQLISMLLKRADALVKSKSKIRKQEAHLFYKVVLLFNDDSQKALIGDIKLKKQGLKSSMEDLLNQTMVSFNTEPTEKGPGEPAIDDPNHPSNNIIMNYKGEGKGLLGMSTKRKQSVKDPAKTSLKDFNFLRGFIRLEGKENNVELTVKYSNIQSFQAKVHGVLHSAKPKDKTGKFIIKINNQYKYKAIRVTFMGNLTAKSRINCQLSEGGRKKKTNFFFNSAQLVEKFGLLNETDDVSPSPWQDIFTGKLVDLPGKKSNEYKGTLYIPGGKVDLLLRFRFSSPVKELHYNIGHSVYHGNSSKINGKKIAIGNALYAKNFYLMLNNGKSKINMEYSLNKGENWRTVPVLYMTPIKSGPGPKGTYDSFLGQRYWVAKGKFEFKQVYAVLAKQSGGAFPVIETAEELTFILKLMEKKKLSSIWLNATTYKGALSQWGNRQAINSKFIKVNMKGNGQLVLHKNGTFSISDLNKKHNILLEWN